MDHWAKGYVTGVDYTYGVYKELSPTWLRSVCCLQYISTPDAPTTYLELGCGQGYGINVLAAANKSDSFIGVDISPTHISGAQRLARSAGLSNVSFLEKSFEDIAANLDDLPACEFIALHGVYSWISLEQRSAVKQIISRKLKTGGVLYISYNCAAGWGATAAFQRVFRDFYQTYGAKLPSIDRVFSRLEIYKELGLKFFSDNRAMSDLLETTKKKPRNYIAHEFLNENWTPFWHKDICDELSECKLTFVGSAHPADNIDRYSIPSHLLEKIREEEPAIKQIITDLSVSRMFRKDVYVRGPSRLPRDLARQAAS